MFQAQSYLEPATAVPKGIDARFLWDLMQASSGSLPGLNTRLADVEQGWWLEHPDLPNGISHLICGQNRVPSQYHGTQTLGVIAAVANNNQYCIGIAPEISYVGVASYYDFPQSEALYEAFLVLGDGDVLLIEAQTNDELMWPIEASPANKQAIMDAIEVGVVVVECAGNGGSDLEAIGLGADSGAILVSASDEHGELLRNPFDGTVPASNYGDRISCHAWGRGVTTLSGPAPLYYTPNYSGTSAAGAIVAGAAVALQSAHKAIMGVPLKPHQMRDVLFTTGTESADNTYKYKMGTMPNLRKAAEALGLASTPPVTPTNLRIVP
jgi:microbial collagenase